MLREKTPCQILHRALTERTATAGVIGLGYVGLPLAVAIARKAFHTVGLDIDPAKATALNAGESYIAATSGTELKQLVDAERFRATSDMGELSQCDVIVICVPTPLTRHREPDLSYIENTAKVIAQHLRPGQLIVLESTTYPGTTREVLKPILEATGLVAGKDFFVGFSPEREDPGNASFDTVTIPKVVAGDGAEAATLVELFYGAFLNKIVPVSSPDTAEAVKITENIFRAVNIALVNELKTIYAAMGIDIWEVVEAAKTKPFGYMPFYPGPGLGGHCIPIDPFYLSWKARELEMPTRFIELAGEINVAMPRYVVEKLASALDARTGRTLGSARILIIGLAYKKNVPDIRESPTFKLMELLEQRGAKVEFHDPHVNEIPPTREHANYTGRKSVTLDALPYFDAVLISTDHDAVDYAAIAKAPLVVDTNVMAKNGFTGAIVKASTAPGDKHAGASYIPRMLRLTDIKLPLGHTPQALDTAIRERLRVRASDILSHTVIRCGHDARKKSAIALIYTLDVAVRDETAVLAKLMDEKRVRPAPDTEYKFVGRAPEGLQERPLVIGAGPCGLFAGLILAQMGFRPIILDRGKVVRERTQDTWGLWRRSVLNPESNVQFGEGGAGTFSDGKLYSQIKDPRFLGRKVLTEFVKAGAPEEILTAAKPHIGTFRLVKMVESLRATIEGLGGEYRFEHRVEDLDIETDSDGARHVRGVVLSDSTRIAARHVVLAVGHSARDTFAMLQERGVFIEAKPFSIGFRIEHPQSLIDRARFGASNKDLGAADYKLVHHASNGRDVYSFCMCPGGTVVAAASEPGRVVTNGMSQYSRNERNANAGIVVGITPADYPGGPLAGIDFQREWEERAFVAGGENYKAPAQKVGDFLVGRASTGLGEVIPSYKPGVTPTDLSSCLPDFAIIAIREALSAFGQQIKGFDMDDAVLTGVETRTSSPIRIGRGDDFQSLNTRGLYPAGEGAGFAGGILSAGVDGIKVAEALAQSMLAESAIKVVG